MEDVPEEQIDLWKERDAKAKMYIIMTTDKSVKQHLLSCQTSKEMFDKLKNIYEKDSEYQKNHLLQEMYSYKWIKSKSVLENVSSIQQIAFQLTALGQEVNEMAVMTKITSILPKEYGGFSTAWDSVQQIDKTLDNFCARLQIEESKLNSNTEEPQVAFHVARPNLKSRISCNYCKKKGHIARECRAKPKQCKYCKRTNHTDGQCFYRNKKFCKICKRTNHNEQDCFYKNKRQERHDRDKGDRAEKESEQKKDEEKKKDEARFCFMAYNKRGGGSPDNSLD